MARVVWGESNFIQEMINRPYTCLINPRFKFESVFYPTKLDVLAPDEDTTAVSSNHGSSTTESTEESGPEANEGQLNKTRKKQKKTKANQPKKKKGNKKEETKQSAKELSNGSAKKSKSKPDRSSALKAKSRSGREDGVAWKSEIKKYHREKTRVKVLGILITIFIIIASVLGFIYFYQVDTDGDGITDVLDTDDDNDGIPDDWEEEYGFNPKDPSDGKGDKDGDGLKNKEEFEFSSNPKKADTDSDSVNDYDECKIHHTLPYVSDTDTDGLPDGWEVQYDLDPNTVDAHLDPDSDGYDANHNNHLDGAEQNTNYMEYINGTNPKINDTDADGMTDGWEMYYQERTNKLKIDIQRYNPPGKRDYNFTFDPNDKSDANEDIDVDENRNISPDGLTNLQEFLADTNPTKPDTDGDSLTDYEEVKKYNTNPLNLHTDNDKLDDGWEIKYGGASVGLDPSKTDSDGDGDPDNTEDLDNDSYMTSFLFNIAEFLLGTSPVSNDTDGDGLTDGWEDYFGLDPLLHNDENDTDGDLLIDRYEFENGTDPNNVDTDGDGLTDGQELMIGFPGVLENGSFITKLKNQVVPNYFTNPLNNDTDDDGLFDGWNDTNRNQIYDTLEEFGEVGDPSQGGIGGYNTNASNNDTDNDGIDDLEEVEAGTDGFNTNPADEDTDKDGLTDKDEIYGAWGYETKPTDSDHDDDGLLDGDEIFTDFYPLSRDTIEGTDPTRPDTDYDGMTDGWENLGFADRSLLETVIFEYDLRYKTSYYQILKDNLDIPGLWLVNPLDPEDRNEDADYDGYDANGDGKISIEEEFNNSEEFEKFSDPLAWNSDSDIMPDGWEVTYSLDPTKDDGDLDTDNDGIVYFINNVEYKDAFTNKEEYLTGEDIDGDGIIDRNTTDPTNPDTDGDKENDYHELWFSDDDDDTLVNGWELIFNGTSNNPDGYVPFNLELTKGKFNPNNWDSDGDFDSDGEEDYDDDQWNNTHEQFTQSPENKNIFYIENAPGCSDPSDDSMTPITVRATSRSGQAQARSVQIDSSEHSRTQTFSIKRTFSRQIILLHPITYQYNRLILMMNIFNQIKIDDIICVLINSNKMEYLKK